MSYPPPPLAVAPGPRLSVVRLPVVAVGFLTLLVVGGIVVWGGGDTPMAASPSAAGGGSGAATYSPAPGTGSTAPIAPFNPADVAPIAGTQVTPTESGAAMAWTAYGSWSSQLSSYQAFFPALGYRLDEQRITSGGGGGAWDIVADAPGYQPAIGLLYIEPNPNDPSTTLVQVEVY